MTINLGTHKESTSMVAMATSNNPCNTYYCVFLDNGDVYEHQTSHKFYPLYGCHGNIKIIIMLLPWQPSKMFVRGRKWPQTLNQMCSPPLSQSSMVAMVTLNNPLKYMVLLLLENGSLYEPQILHNLLLD